jgi:hypothetical protein
MGLGHFLAPFPKPTTVHQNGSTPAFTPLLNIANCPAFAIASAFSYSGLHLDAFDI